MNHLLRSRIHWKSRASSRFVVGFLDLLLLTGVAGLVWLAADPSRFGSVLEPGATAGLLLWFPLILLLRTAVEERPPLWIRWAYRWRESPGLAASEGARRTTVAALAGSSGTSLGLLGGWATVHPLTDYPVAVALVPIALAGSLGIGLVAGPTVFLWTGGHERRLAKASRFALLGGAIVTLGCIAAWDPSRGWSFPRAFPVLAGWAVGSILFACVAATVWVALSRARVVRRVGLALSLALLPALVLAWASRPLPARDAAPTDWPHAVLLITVDTLRADHLGAYGYERDTSPRIDALAADSVLFERAYAPMPTTDPSHVAMLTGALPRTSGVTKNGMASAGQPSLASWFVEQAYRTGAVTSRAHLEPGELRLPGFQSASVPLSSSPAQEAHRRASSWIDRHGDRPFFLWVHFWDPHAPYTPPEKDAAPFLRGLRPSRFAHGIHPYVSRSRPHTPEEVRWATALYDAEIHHADAWVGRLIADTRERFGADEVLVVLSSDHGETLDEFDSDRLYAFDHGKLLARHELHVPLVIGWPGRLPAGLRVEQPVPTAGLAATVAALLGGEFESDVPGFQNLLNPDAVATSSGQRLLLVERRTFATPAKIPFLDAPERGVIAGDWLFVENPVRGATLQEMEADPRGRHNLVHVETQRARELSDRLQVLIVEHPTASAASAAVDREKLEKLRSLGYIE